MNNATVETIASNRQLFIDDFLIDRLAGASLRLHQPRNEGVFLRFDKPWEGVHTGFATIFRVDDTCHIYYRGMPDTGDGSEAECTCLAFSADGVTAEKPDLGRHEVFGTRRNNVILKGWQPFSHNFMPFYDTRPGVPAEEQFKAVAGLHRTGLHFFDSTDGVVWRKRSETPGISSQEFAFDSPNIAFWSAHENRYLCYFRTWKNKIRWVSRSTSEDFSEWSDPEEMVFVHNGEPAPAEHIYTTGIRPYFRAQEVSIAFPRRFMAKRRALSEAEADAMELSAGQRDSCSDTIFVSSRGGTEFRRTFLEAFIRPGPERANWSSRSCTVGAGIIQTGPAEMSLYRTEHYGSPSIHVKRYSLRLDGFSSVHAPYSGGETVTRPLVFTGDRLTVNYETSAAGGLRVEIQDADGSALPGYSLAEADELLGDEIERTVSWSGDPSVAPLAGRTVRLRFALKDADLYSFVFLPGTERSS